MDPGRDIFNVELREILAVPGIREVIAEPRISPREVREELAAILAADLVLGEPWETSDRGQTCRRLGSLFYLLSAARCTPAWEKLRALAAKNRMIALLCLSSALEALLATQDEVAAGQLPSDRIEAVVAFEELVAETLALWGRKPTGRMPAPSPNAGLEAEFYGTDANVSLVHHIVRQQLLPRLSAAAEEISDSVDTIELTDLLAAGRGWDYALATLRQEDIQAIRRYSDVARRSRRLMAMIDDLGRASARCAADGTWLPHSGGSEVHSIVTSGDISYLLPSELVKLQDKVLKYLFFARWTDGKLLTYHLQDRSKPVLEARRKKGPVVALVDTSGSMDGAPGLVSKAIVLAAAKKFLKEGRAMKVILFSSVRQVIEIDLKAGPLTQFLHFLKASYGGGTDFDTALHAGLQALQGEEYAGADLLFITDGMSRLTDESLTAGWRRLKETRGSQIFTVIVGNDQPGGLEEISDRVYIFGVRETKNAAGSLGTGTVGP